MTGEATAAAGGITGGGAGGGGGGVNAPSWLFLNGMRLGHGRSSASSKPPSTLSAPPMLAPSTVRWLHMQRRDAVCNSVWRVLSPPLPPPMDNDPCSNRQRMISLS